MLDESKLLSLVAAGENASLDFKRELDLSTGKGKSELVKDVIAIANSSLESGYIVVGIEDDKTILGINSLEEERIQQIVHTYVHPPVIISCYLLPIRSLVSSSLGILEVKPTNKPHSVARAIDRLEQHEVYVRHGSVVMRASPQEIIKMSDEQKQTSHISRIIKSAEAHLRLGNFENAIAAYSEAINAFPTAALLLSRSRVYLHTRQRDLWLKDVSGAVTLADSVQVEKQARLERFKNLSSRSPIWDRDLYWLREKTEGREQAEILYLAAKIIRDDTVFFEIDTAPVVDMLNDAIHLGYTTPETYFWRSEAHYGVHNYGLALQDIDTAISLHQGNRVELVEYLDHKARILAGMGKINEIYSVYLEIRKLLSGQDPSDYWSITYKLIDEVLCRYALDIEFNRVDTDHHVPEILFRHFADRYNGITKEYPDVAPILKKLFSK